MHDFINETHTFAMGDGTYFFSLEISSEMFEHLAGEDGWDWGGLFASLSINSSIPLKDRPDDFEQDADGEIPPPPPPVDPSNLPTPGGVALLGMGLLVAVRRRR